MKKMNKIISVFCLLILLTAVIFPMPKASAAAAVYGAGKVKTSSTSLNVRSSASSSASVVSKLSNGAYVTLVSKSGSFWRVRYGASAYGYCSSSYITVASKAVRAINAKNGLKVHKSASLSSTVKATLSYGTVVTVLSSSGSFSKILYNGVSTGYVVSSYLSSTAAVQSTYKAISLSVPSYKQTDSRWSSTTVGSSGQTIGKIGCATTALAMTESYRTGTTIYPNKMAAKLSYSAGGAVYWPSNYTVDTNGSNLYAKIYNLLKAGKPVIIGAKNSSGGQHYVVIKGVSACSSLSASAFKINDPGSATRTTLSQYFAVYPNFYKLLSY